tara:strand:+ start:1534 stop:2481 length:948 start_codon:yes stop_codon:yes gene_type:complete
VKILITGAAGFIGFHLAKALCKKNYHIVGIDNLDDYYDQSLKKHRLSILNKYKNFSFFKSDLKELAALNENFDLAINLAAQAGVRLPESMHYKYEISNIEGFNFFLDFCEKREINKIIYASSSSVYGNHPIKPFVETLNLLEPVNRYAASKMANEVAANVYQQKHNINLIGLRFFTVYGPSGRPDMAYFNFAQKILNNEEIKLFDNGKLQRDMTYIDDIIDGIIGAIEYSSRNEVDFQIFNLGNEKPIQTTYLLSLIEKKLNKSTLIKNINRSKEVRITYADCAKALKVFGYSPKVEIEDGISEFLRWYTRYYKI